MDNLRQFLKVLEGQETGVHDDSQGNPTIGSGINLNAPGTEDQLKQYGLSKEQLLSGQDVDPTILNKLMDDRMLQSKQRLLDMQKKSFPNAKLLPNEETALSSLVFNNPNLVGPELRRMLASEDKKGVIREILLRSNKDKVPGILKRRIEEAKMYKGGNPFEDIEEGELIGLQEMVNKLENPNVKEEFLNKYPELNPTNRFLNIKRNGFNK